MTGNIILAEIPFELDAEKLAERAHLPDDDPEMRRAWETLLDRVRGTARPKAVYRDCAVTARDAAGVGVEGLRLESRVLADQLGDRRRLFAYCATCGTETACFEDELDPLERFWLEEIRMDLLRQAKNFLDAEIRRRHRIPRLGGMSPGSGDADVWPLSEQLKVFALLGNRVAADIGVELTDGLLMIPYKSISGVLYAAEHDFATCQLCHREPCPNRRAPFDRALHEKMN